MTEPEKPRLVPECLECGACCFSSLPTYVRVTGEDHSRLGPVEAKRVTRFIGNRCYMGTEDGHCAALVILPEGRFVCSVYESRPEVCRSLERGSPACHGELHEKSARRTNALLQIRKLA